MRDYSKVGPKFWIGATGKRLRAAGMEAQIVGMYLLTSPHANMLGLFYCPLAFIAHETGLGIEGASKGLNSAIEAGFCEYDEASEVVWVIEMASYQVGEALKPNDLRAKGVQNEYNSLPENPYLARFFDKYGVAFCMTSSRGKTSPFNAPSKPHGSQEQEQEQEQELPPLPQRADKFEIHPEWQPSAHFPAQMLQAGLPESILSIQNLTEFISYWKTRDSPPRHTQSEWDHKFLKSLINTKNKSGGSHANGSSGTRKLTSHERLVAANSAAAAGN